MIAIVTLSHGFCVYVGFFVNVCLCVCVCVYSLVKDDSTIFCKKADRRVAVAIATVQPGFVSSSSEFFFFSHRDRQKKTTSRLFPPLSLFVFLLTLQTNTC